MSLNSASDVFRRHESADCWKDLMPIERYNVIYDLNRFAEQRNIGLRISQSSTVDEVMALADALDEHRRQTLDVSELNSLAERYGLSARVTMASSRAALEAFDAELTQMVRKRINSR